jgi:chloramphenicol O-acetyltransferase
MSCDKLSHLWGRILLHSSSVHLKILKDGNEKFHCSSLERNQDRVEYTTVIRYVSDIRCERSAQVGVTKFLRPARQSQDTMMVYLKFTTLVSKKEKNKVKRKSWLQYGSVPKPVPDYMVSHTGENENAVLFKDVFPKQ